MWKGIDIWLLPDGSESPDMEAFYSDYSDELVEDWRASFSTRDSGTWFTLLDTPTLYIMGVGTHYSEHKGIRICMIHKE